MDALKYFAKCSFSDDSNQLEVFEYCAFFVFLPENELSLVLNYRLLYLVFVVWVIFFCVALVILCCCVLLISESFSVIKVQCRTKPHLIHLRSHIFFQEISVSVSEFNWRETVNTSLLIFLGRCEAFQILLIDVEDLQVFAA